MPSFKTLDDLDARGRRVLVRADLNVPLADGRVADAARLELLAPTVAELTAKGARVVIISHLGRPKGGADPALSLGVVRGSLAAALGGRTIAFAGDCVGPAAAAVVNRLGDGEVALLENLRFHPGEEANDPDFARALAELGDAYVNDAFSAAHRDHASTAALARLLPAAAGRLMQAELEHLGRALDSPARPLVAIVGGAKVSTKIELLGNLVRKVDRLAIGGRMANTFLHARGIGVGKSLCERDMAETARGIEAAAEGAGCELILPSDGVVAAAFEEGTPCETLPIEAVPADAMILDIGPVTVGRVRAALEASRTLVWNGPLGAFEIPPFDEGTNAVAGAAAALTRRGALLSVAGGGDTMAALAHAGVAQGFSYVSSAGGAFLEWLEGRTLPGVAALEAAASRA